MPVVLRCLACLVLATLAACGPDPRYVPNVGHPPVLQQVNTVAKARAFFTGTTRAFQQSGSNEIVVQYFAPGGQVYSAIAGDTDMRLGAWAVDKKGRTYPVLCLNGADTPGTGDCVSAVDLLSDGPRGGGLYRGDVLGLAQSRVPSALTAAATLGSVEALMLAMGRSDAGLNRLSFPQ